MVPQNKLMEQRIEKLRKIEELGINPYPYRYRVEDTARDVLAKYSGLANEEKKDVKLKLAGRIMLLRKMGKASFGHIQDYTGKIQFYIRQDEVGEEGYKLFMKDEINPSIELASFLFLLYQKNYKVVFSMPYSKNIEGSVELFVQEISESTGKDNKGMMGAYQSAPLCQHSVLEYLLGGSKGAVIPILWTIDEEIVDVTLDSSIDYVNGKSAQTIVNYQANATFQALIEQAVPSAKIIIKKPDLTSIGYLVAFIQSTVYHLCMLLDVNWANNPKVVIGKKICNEALQNLIPSDEQESTRKRIADEKFKNL